MSLSTENLSVLESILAKLRTVYVDKFKHLDRSSDKGPDVSTLGYIFFDENYSYEIGREIRYSTPDIYFVEVKKRPKDSSDRPIFQYKTNHSNDSINFHSIRELYTNIDTERRRWEKEVKQYQENEKKNQFQSDLDKFKKHLG